MPIQYRTPGAEHSHRVKDTEYPHLHFVFNDISHIDGHRYRGGKKEYYDLYHLVRRILKGFRIKELMPVDYRETDGDE